MKNPSAAFPGNLLLRRGSNRPPGGASHDGSDMWLLLTESDDASGPWLAEGLRRHTAHPVLVVTTLDLETAAHQERGVDPEGVWFRVVLDDGRVIESKRLLGAVNRAGPATRGVAHFTGGRRGAVATGYGPPLLRWLHRWEGTVLNRPNAAGRSGEHRSAFWWVDNAVHAGFAMPRSPAAPAGAEADGPGIPLIVVQEEVFPATIGDRPVPPQLALRCVQLARRTGTSILGVRAAATPIGGWRFVSATLRPDLTTAGEELQRAIARALGIAVARLPFAATERPAP